MPDNIRRIDYNYTVVPISPAKARALCAFCAPHRMQATT